jgi:hypothetical protein
MTTPLFDYSIAAELRRLADALEGLLALARAHVTPAAATAAPADRDSVQQAFDAMMGNPLQALGNLTAVAAPAAEPFDDGAPFDGYKPRSRVHWSKYDPRSRELARLRTAANHRAIAAKTSETRDAALVESAVYHNESQSRHGRLRRWLAEGKIVVDGDNLYRVAADGTKTPWVPSSTLTLPE